MTAVSSVPKDKTPNIGQYIACVNDGHWWLGVVLDHSEENGDYSVKLMSPKGHSKVFKWLAREDIWWIPKTDILCVTAAPTTCRLAKSKRNHTNTFVTAL